MWQVRSTDLINAITYARLVKSIVKHFLLTIEFFELLLHKWT